MYPVRVSCQLAFVISSLPLSLCPPSPALLPATASRCHYVNEIVANYYFYFSLSIFSFFLPTFRFSRFRFRFRFVCYLRNLFIYFRAPVVVVYSPAPALAI